VKHELDPSNNKTVLEIQGKNAQREPEALSKSKGKRKALAEDPDNEDESQTMDVDVSSGEEGSEEDLEVKGGNFVPMPSTGGIQQLREKLHARMAALRRDKEKHDHSAEAGNRDELLEERRRQRADLRERRRKATREKIQSKKQGKNKKQDTGPSTKVRVISRGREYH
jgi:hypothetical protein